MTDHTEAEALAALPGEHDGDVGVGLCGLQGLLAGVVHRHLVVLVMLVLVVLMMVVVVVLVVVVEMVVLEMVVKDMVVVVMMKFAMVMIIVIIGLSHLLSFPESTEGVLV